MTEMTEEKGTALRHRDKIEDRLKWDLSDIFPSDDAWEEGFKKAEGMLGKAADFAYRRHVRGTLQCELVREIGQSMAHDRRHVFSPVWLLSSPWVSARAVSLTLYSIFDVWTFC